MIRTLACVYQVVRNVSFAENFAYVLNGQSLGTFYVVLVPELSFAA